MSQTTTTPSSAPAASTSAELHAAPAPRSRAPKLPKRRKQMGIDARPGFLVYGLLTAFLLASAYPLWWSFVMGSSDNSARGETWPPLLPGGQFWNNVGEVMDSIPFWLDRKSTRLNSSHWE